MGGQVRGEREMEGRGEMRRKVKTRKIWEERVELERGCERKGRRGKEDASEFR